MIKANAPRTAPSLSRSGAATCISVTSPRRMRAASDGGGRSPGGKSLVPFPRGGGGVSERLPDFPSRVCRERERNPTYGGGVGLKGGVCTVGPVGSASEEWGTR